MKTKTWYEPCLHNENLWALYHASNWLKSDAQSLVDYRNALRLNIEFKALFDKTSIVFINRNKIIQKPKSKQNVKKIINIVWELLRGKK